jgi:DNA-binding NarL/FixJ family response regulator
MAIPMQDSHSLPVPNTPRRKRILVVDDHEILRCGWHQLISVEDDLEICSEAGSVPEALKLVEQCHPDIVVTDITLPGCSGLELVKELKMLHPDIPVLVVSMHDERVYGERVLRAGGRGYVMKETASDQLVDAIRQVLRGKTYVSEALASVFLEGMFLGAPAKFPIDRLTNRELEVFDMIGRGHSQMEIAEALGVEPRTIEAHRTNIRKKFGLPDSNALFRFAVRRYESLNHSP